MKIAIPARASELNTFSRLTVLRTRGHFVSERILSPETWARLVSDVQTAGHKGHVRTGALLQYSDVLLEVLENVEFGSLIDGAIGDDATLSLVQGLAESRPKWQHDFAHIRCSTPPRSFRCGVTALISLRADNGPVEVLRGSQNLPEGAEATMPSFPQIGIHVKPGSALILEGGVHYLLPALGEWLKLIFLRPWIKPQILYSSALDESRLALFGPRGRRWCGLDIRLPISVKEFLTIEEAALDSAVGRAKGSGI